jgi:hypothetical protein
MAMRFAKTIKESTPDDRVGSSANTGKAVLRLSARGREVSLLLPIGTDLSSVDGLQLLNERLTQIEEHLARLDEMEVQLAMKFGYGSLATLTTTAKPITGAKVTLDKIGTWLLLGSWDFDGTGAVEGFIVIDPETTAGAKRQDAIVRTTADSICTAWCLFTVTEIPRLAQLYGKLGSGAFDVIAAGTSICAIWLGRWKPGEKRFGRQMPSYYTSAQDMDFNTLTDHGEEARWPYSDDSTTVSNGVDQTGL